MHTLFPEEVLLKMWPLPIGELFMAGRSSVEALKKLEIDTIGELANADLGLIELHLKAMENAVELQTGSIIRKYSGASQRQRSRKFDDAVGRCRHC